MIGQSLDAILDGWYRRDPSRRALAEVVRALTGACKQIAWLISDGPLGGDLGAAVGGNVQGEVQKVLDAKSNALIVAACARAPVHAVASEELDVPLLCRPDADLLVAIDPLDGSSNIEVNLSIGTIFSVLPRPAGAPASEALFLQPGTRQLAAGYVLYGPQTTLVLTTGEGVDVFTLDHRAGDFILTRSGVALPATTAEFAINLSNRRHWPAGVRAYVEECLAGRDGPRGADTNMRWVASLVAECQRVLARGGVFLYPADARPGYGRGRLRYLYEAAPLGLVVEQAGGRATDGRTRILDLTPGALHEKVPFVFGSREEVERVARHLAAHA